MASVEITQRRAKNAGWRRRMGVIDAGVSTSRAGVARPLHGAGGRIAELTNPSGMTVGFSLRHSILRDSNATEFFDIYAGAASYFTDFSARKVI